MDKRELRQLFERYLRNEGNEKETAKLLNLFGEQLDEADLKQLILQALQAEVHTEFLESPGVKAALMEVDDNLTRRLFIPKSGRFIAYRRYAMVAILTLVCSVAFYIYRQLSHGSPANGFEVLDATPAKDKAMLTLADGSKVVLDEIKDGTVWNDHGITITRTANGELLYTASNSATAKNEYNELSTPRGGYFQVVLPDGSKVWLNAASTLKYPTRFSKDSRTVTLDGEAFFKVKRMSASADAHGGNIPFIVKTQDQEIEVLGTEFNVMAYTNASTTKTTLAEGSVRVSQNVGNATPNRGRDMHTAVLKPGQQATSGNGNITVTQVDIDNEISWKNGQFTLYDMPLIDVLSQLSRWYDVEVDPTDMPDTRYTVFLSRQVKLSSVLQLLEKSGDLQFKLDDTNHIVVTPKTAMPM